MNWLVGCVLLVVVLLPGGAEALENCGAGAQRLERVELEGLSATSASTVLELLPREPPSSYSRRELEEFERRLNNLGIFDAVDVACGLGSLAVRVREKWTLVPEVDFATGRTFADTYALAGVTEYNFLGTADTLSLNVFLEQRGFGAKIAFNEHDYRRRGWSLGSSLSLATAAFRFEDETGWRTTSATLELTARSPPWLHEYFNYLAGFYGSSESVYEVRGVQPPPSTQMAQSFMAFSWDGYEWHDLVPSGVQASIWLSIGGLFGVDPPKPRHTAELLFRGAIPLGAHAVLLSRLEAAVGTRGNVNYSFPLGSVSGVRGLPDATYFNWAQAYANVELRRSFQLWPRWALQLVGFLDAAAFEPLTVDGGRGRGDVALSLGMGVRVVPTWISSIALRLDGARLLAPDGSWFAQLGLNQYF